MSDAQKLALAEHLADYIIFYMGTSPIVPTGLLAQIRESNQNAMEKDTEHFNTYNFETGFYYCGNCGTPRTMDGYGNVEECPRCHDDEFNRHVAEESGP